MKILSTWNLPGTNVERSSYMTPTCVDVRLALAEPTSEIPFYRILYDLLMAGF